MIGAERRAQGIERAIKLLCCGELGSPVVRKCSNGLTSQASRIFNAGDYSGGCKRAADPLPAGIRNRDQMSSQITAIH